MSITQAKPSNLGRPRPGPSRTALLSQPRIGGKAARAATLLTWAGSLLVAGSGVLHLFLWLNYGYRNLPTIGPLFLMQALVAVVLALWTSASRHWLLTLAEAGFALATAGGLLISIFVGLFGWQEASNGPWVWEALVIEFGAAAFLLTAGALFARAWLKARPTRPAQAGQPGAAGAAARPPY